MYRTLFKKTRYARRPRFALAYKKLATLVALASHWVTRNSLRSSPSLRLGLQETRYARRPRFALAYKKLATLVALASHWVTRNSLRSSPSLRLGLQETPFHDHTHDTLNTGPSGIHPRSLIAYPDTKSG